MYKDDMPFTQPGDEDCKVWRFLDFTKFVSLLISKKLFLTRADRFEDPFEGSWPKRNVEKRWEIPEGMNSLWVDVHKSRMTGLSEFGKTLREYVAISCWHMNAHESAAMWKLYLKSDEGVAIQTTYKKLKQGLERGEDFSMGEVQYIDYKTEMIPGANAFLPYMYKRKSFEHEKEVRVVVNRIKDYSLVADSPIEGGIEIDVDSPAFIETVFISPTAAPWFTDVVNGVVDRFGLRQSLTIDQSNLTDQPVF